MAQLLLIKAESLAADNRQIGDIVGIYDDAHVFSEQERVVFDIVTVAASKDTAVMDAHPEVATATRAKTTEWTLEQPEEKQVWKDATGEWREIAVQPRFPLRYEKGVIKENFSRYPENLLAVAVTERTIEESR